MSRLFERFSVWADEADPDQPKLIDVEVRLRRGQKSRSAEMVDLLFLDDDARLTFVEVKREYDSRVRSTKTPEVVCQVRRYEKRLTGNEVSIMEAYREVGGVLGDAFGLEPFDAPAEVFRRVPVLVCRRHRRGVEQDKWLRPLLSRCADGHIDPGHLVVDGGAIGVAVSGEGRCPPWCEDGLWENLNLKMVFVKIRSLQEPSSAQGST